MNLAIAFILLALALIAVAIGRRYGSSRKIRYREELAAEAILSAPQWRDLDRGVYNEVARRLAAAGKLKYQQIRPSDKLKDVLSADSWEMGQGQEGLELWLKKQGITLTDTAHVKTVSDLVVVVQQAIQRQH